jgi:hypothetical protein
MLLVLIVEIQQYFITAFVCMYKVCLGAEIHVLCPMFRVQFLDVFICSYRIVHPWLVFFLVTTIRQNCTSMISDVLVTNHQDWKLIVDFAQQPGVFIFDNKNVYGPGSSVGIATAYGLDGPGIESRWGRDFPHLPRPALRPPHPYVQWVPGLSRG